MRQWPGPSRQMQHEFTRCWLGSSHGTIVTILEVRGTSADQSANPIRAPGQYSRGTACSTAPWDKMVERRSYDPPEVLEVWFVLTG